MAKTASYSALNVSASIDGVQIIGLFDGDNAIQVERNADVGTGLVGIQGDAIFSQSADNSAMVTLRLMHTSATHRQLLQKLEAQKSGVLRPFPFTFTDTDSNEGGTGDEFFVQKSPSVTKGSNATVREWQLWTGDWKPNITNP